MALNRDKFRKIVGGITTAQPAEADAAAVPPPPAPQQPKELPQPEAGEGSSPAGNDDAADATAATEHRRFAMRGRPKGRKDAAPASKGRKVKVSLFLSEYLVNDFYEWAHQDRIHPGEMFERALKPFHDREAKRRNDGKR
jgi:hypothetical protein